MEARQNITNISYVLVCLTLSTFRRRSGLFFWSLIMTTISGSLIALVIALDVWVIQHKLLWFKLFVYNLGKGS
jgi:hypothetical protein